MSLIIPQRTWYAFNCTGHYISECDFVGQFLVDPDNKCQHLRCDYGSEPWRDSQGNIQLYTIPLPCPPGTAVNTENFNQDNPCSEHSTTCPVGRCN